MEWLLFSYHLMPRPGIERPSVELHQLGGPFVRTRYHLSHRNRSKLKLTCGAKIIHLPMMPTLANWKMSFRRSRVPINLNFCLGWCLSAPTIYGQQLGGEKTDHFFESDSKDGDQSVKVGRKDRDFILIFIFVSLSCHRDTAPSSITSEPGHYRRQTVVQGCLKEVPSTAESLDLVSMLSRNIGLG